MPPPRYAMSVQLPLCNLAKTQEPWCSRPKLGKNRLGSTVFYYHLVAARALDWCLGPEAVTLVAAFFAFAKEQLHTETCDLLRQLQAQT